MRNLTSSPSTSHSRALIVAVTAVFTILLYRLQIDARAGHIDEYDYLFVGKTLMSGDFWPTHSYIFGWDFNWLLLGWGDKFIGGIAGARTVTSVLGIISLLGMYSFVYQLWRNHSIAQIAALLLCVDAAHLYTSKLATYDIISFTFLIWSLSALLLACLNERQRWLWTIISAVLLIGAVLSKYTALVYLPFIGALVLFYAPKQALLGFIIIASAIITYVTIHFDQLNILYDVQISGTHGKNASTSDILLRTGKQLLVLLMFSVIGFSYALMRAQSQVTKILLLLIMALPIFSYHLVGQNIISLQKHLVFSSLFLIPIVAWLIQRVIRSLQSTNKRYVFVIVTALVLVFFNYQNLQVMRTSYPSVQSFLPFAENMNFDETILSEDPYLFRYLLHGKLKQSQIKETSWLDNNSDGVHEHLDVQHAVWDRKFEYVFLNDQQHASSNRKLREMLALRGYVTLLEEPYQLATMSGAIRTGLMSLHARQDSEIATLVTHNKDVEH